jgi:hypothetical protein
MMEEEENTESLIRYAPLSEELRPVSIFAGDPAVPIKADWIGISHCVVRLPPRSEEIESYIVNFYSERGELLEALQFETLNIALDQAKSIAGIAPSDWRNCNVPVPDDRRVSWDAIERKE